MEGGLAEGERACAKGKWVAAGLQVGPSAGQWTKFAKALTAALRAPSAPAQQDSKFSNDKKPHGTQQILNFKQFSSLYTVAQARSKLATLA